ncbi:MAG: hypothetical protein AAF741_18730 [Bacteroidota bacterium]
MNFQFAQRKLKDTADVLASWWVLCLILLLFGCKADPPSPLEIQYYHWQTVLDVDSLNHDLLGSSTRKELFVKVSDFRWSEAGPEAVAQLVLAQDSIGYRLQPVVFITNEVLIRLPEEEIRTLAEMILAAAARSNTDFSTYSELQMDCDWTRGSANKYFALLETLRDLLPDDVRLSCTVRLHQWRDYQEQGIPPVDRGVLMAYNSGDLDSWETENSILDTTASAYYLKPRPRYDLPLDIALPTYGWGAIYRRNELAYLVDGLTAADLADTARFRQLTPTRFELKRSTYLDGLYCYQGDLIRLEASDSARVEKTFEQLMAVAPRFEGQRVFYFRI